jgi:hypothetical protein
MASVHGIVAAVVGLLVVVGCSQSGQRTSVDAGTTSSSTTSIPAVGVEATDVEVDRSVDLVSRAALMVEVPGRDAVAALEDSATAAGLTLCDPPPDEVEARFSEAELRAAQAAPIGVIPSVYSASVIADFNRAEFDLWDPTADDLARLGELADPAMFCVNVWSSAIPEGPLNILPTGGADDLLTCGVGPFRRAALLDPVTLEEANHPAAAVALDFLADGDAGTPQTADSSDRPPKGPGWLALAVDDRQVLFGLVTTTVDQAGVVDQPTPTDYLIVERRLDEWRIGGWGGCRLEAAGSPYLNRVEIYLDPDGQAPSPTSTIIDIVVHEVACASAMAMGERLVGPQIIETADEVTVAFAAAMQPFANCDGSPYTPMTLELSAPLGDRMLIDGMAEPPRVIDYPDWFDGP